MEILLTALWFFAPAGWANAAPVFASKLPGLRHWKTPMDFGKTYRGKELLGENKTWRGLVFGVFIGGAIAALQYYIWLPPLLSDKSLGFMILLGMVLAFGALLGDAVESFFKRQAGIDSGKSWFPFDQIDYIIGGLAASLLLVRLPLSIYLGVVIIYFGLHLVTVFLGYKVGLREQPI